MPVGAEIFAGIFVHRHDDEWLPLEAGLERRDRRLLAGQSEVEDVGTSPWAKAHGAPWNEARVDRQSTLERPTFGAQPFGPFEERSSARVAFYELALLVIRERDDTQSQKLVDLGAVEKVSRTFRRHACEVGKNDRRRK